MASRHLCLLCLLLAVTASHAQPAAPPPANLAEAEFKVENVNRAGFSTDAFKFTFERAAVDNVAGTGRDFRLDTAPVLATLPRDGIAQALVTLQPCSVLQPHVHPRASEVYFVLEGALSSGFLEENGGRTILQNVTVNQNALIPQGLVHYLYNGDCIPARYLSSLDNRDPGTATIYSNLLKFPTDVLTATTGLDAATIERLRASLPTPTGPYSRNQDCLARCGLLSPPPASPAAPTAAAPAAGGTTTSASAAAAASASAGTTTVTTGSGRKM